jgi:hypothetical protein
MSQQNKKITFRIVNQSILAAWAAKIRKEKTIAVVLGNSIHLHNCSEEYFLSNRRWLCHELIHVKQYKKYGVLGFICRYFWEYLKHGYEMNKFELEAWALEDREEIIDEAERIS